ncbi:MAG: outer membrane protein assembly factor BamD [Gammaproteobacteria bacterium]|nr:outer membrane protein assembly factor BamD [Gammaproteobacteria bacterium]
MNDIRTLFVMVIACWFVAGCSMLGFSNIKTKEEYELTSEQKLYEAAQNSIRSGNYSVGIERLQAIETHFPFGQFAEQAQLELIYAYFMKSDFEGAKVAAERFVELHPKHPHADYAFYMKGLASYEQDRGFFDRFLGSPQASRDVSNAEQAFIEFNDLLQNYPNSLYAKDAKARMIHLRNIMAEHELLVAQYYLENDVWVAAANRAAGIVEDFPSSSSVPVALAIVVEANYKLGLTKPANDALRVLALNFPNYADFDARGNLVLRDAANAQNRSLTNILSFGLLDRPRLPPPLEIGVTDIPQTAEAPPSRDR